MATSHLVVLFTCTAGQNGENLGSDETQIVLFVYLLYDVSNNKVVCLNKHYVKPVGLEDIGDQILTEECRIQTGFDEDAIRNAMPLEQVLDEFDRFVRAKEVHPDHSGKPFTFIMDGQLHARMVLHPEACRKNITLASYLNRFYDIRKEFKRFYKVDVVNCIKDMLDFQNLEQLDQSMDYGGRHCQEMASIIHRLINDGHSFTEGNIEVVKDRLEPGICTKDTVVDDESVIRARGLPWQSSDQDIAKFFKGLNVAKGGVALCLSQQGRRNGEALIRFENKEHRDLALRKHKHHLGQRYIEVYRASGKDFIDVAGGNNTEAQQFLSRHSDDGGQVIVRMRGLPYSCTTEQVLEFFRSNEPPCEVLDGENGILFVHQADGRATGDAFVLFRSEEESAKALAKHRQCIGARYIELFKSTTAEVQQVLNRSMDPRANTTPNQDAHLPPLLPQIPGMNHSPLPGLPAGVMLPQQLITSGTQRDCIRLRGLPFEATVTDILTFLGEFSRNIVFQGVHMVYNAQGTPSGESFIQMDNEQAAEICALAKHKKFMFINGKKRYIEVIQCSGEDMNLVLTNGLGALNGAPTIIPTSLPSAPTTATFPTALPTHPQLLPTVPHRPLISPGGTMLHAQAPATIPTQGGTFNGILPYGTQITAQPATALAVSAAGALPSPASIFNPATAALPPHMTQLGPRPSVAPYYSQQMLYWYPSPPVSPQSAYYVQTCPTTVVMKGVPYNTQAADILTFLEGIFEIPPDVQIQRSSDGRPSGEAYVTFSSRTEAERAVLERNRKVLHSRLVEMHMA